MPSHYDKLVQGMTELRDGAVNDPKRNQDFIQPLTNSINVKSSPSVTPAAKTRTNGTKTGMQRERERRAGSGQGLTLMGASGGTGRTGIRIG